jgi:phage-related protein
MTALPNILLSYGTEMTQEYRRKRIQMGDSYSVRARDGVNAEPQQWRLTWENVTHAQAEQLRLFFKALGGVDIVDWKPFNQDATLKWTATGFQSAPSTFGKSTCSVTLTQEFDL